MRKHLQGALVATALVGGFFLLCVGAAFIGGAQDPVHAALGGTAAFGIVAALSFLGATGGQHG